MRPSAFAPYPAAPAAEPRPSVSPRLGIAASVTALAFALAPSALAALTVATAPVASANPFLSALWVALGGAIIWSFFYWGLYPRLLPHFGEVGARAIFWPGVLLYLCSWLHLSSYLIFTFGFYTLWFQWTSLALVGLLSIWFLISFSRS